MLHFPVIFPKRLWNKLVQGWQPNNEKCIIKTALWQVFKCLRGNKEGSWLHGRTKRPWPEVRNKGKNTEAAQGWDSHWKGLVSDSKTLAALHLRPGHTPPGKRCVWGCMCPFHTFTLADTRWEKNQTLVICSDMPIKRRRMKFPPFS